MPKQEYTGKRNNIVSIQSLNYGQLAEIVDDGPYCNMIVTKAFNSFVAVYVPKNKNRDAFEVLWDNNPDFNVRILDPEEKVILSNEN